MVNTHGINGSDNGAEPPADQLATALHRYARERLPHEARIRRLAEEFGYHIRTTKLKQLHRKYNIPVARKPPPMEEVTTLVCEKLEEDVHRRNGPDTVMRLLSLDGYAIPRSMIRQVMLANDPHGAEMRWPGARGKIVRKTLQSCGVFHEINCDGHEKFSSMALGMGPVSIPVYGMRDKWSGTIAQLRAVPNARKAVVVGHLYLDLVETYGAIPLQITVDHGSETGDMYALHVALRKNYTPDLDTNEWPPFIALSSTHNIPIENLWSRLRKTTGMNIQAKLQEGRTNGLFNPANEVHVNLFHWLWPRIVQERLNYFADYWNSHRVRKQTKKAMPSGGTPLDFFSRPQDFGGQRLGQPIDPVVVQDLRSTLSMTRKEALRWVDDEFDEAATEVYTNIGSPALSLESGWRVFAQMSADLELL